MDLPNQVPVMTLPAATLFPQALLPLYIFEPRYREMLADTLKHNRMFSVAMQKPGRTRETPCPIAGLGLIRVSVGHNDGTSHLILQGLTRVKLQETVQYKPYRVQRIAPRGQPAFPPLGESRAEWRTLLELARKLNRPLGWQTPEKIFRALAEAVAPLSGVSYETIGSQGAALNTVH